MYNMPFDPDLSFNDVYKTSTAILSFKIVDQSDNPICAAASASVNGSICAYNSDYSEIRASDGTAPEDLGELGNAAHYFGSAMNISMSSNTETIAFKFKDASGNLYPVTVSGLLDIAVVDASKIGRASCRERG